MSSVVTIALVILVSYYVEAADRVRRCSECDDSQMSQCENELSLKQYTDSGCTANFDDETCCPSSYNCSLLYDIATMNYTGCYYRGRKYERTVDIGDPCRSCSCRSGRQSVNCRAIDCRIDRKPTKKGCVKIYNPGSCCAKQILCGNDTIPKPNVTVTCEYEGRVYLEGERIIRIPKRHCRICVCTKDFKGPDSPSCYDMACMLKDLGSIQRGCLPVYRNGDCCPSEWHCPNTTAPVSGQDNYVKYTESPEECVFEGKTYSQGSTVDVVKQNLKCSCDVPPLPTCSIK